MVFSVSHVGSDRHPYGKSLNHHPYLTLQTKITVKVIRGLNVKAKQQQHMFSRESKWGFLKAQNEKKKEKEENKKYIALY